MSGTNENVEYLSILKERLMHSYAGHMPTLHARFAQKKSKTRAKSDKGIHMGYTFDLCKSPICKLGKRARVVEWTGLENQRRGNPSVSSNLTASARIGALAH